MKNTAVVILACMDYESLEISLANYMENTDSDAHFFILQNGRGTYCKERTYRCACRYRNLYPDRITVVDWIPEQSAYFSIKDLINSDCMKNYKYVCKVDDDTFPVTKDWLNKLKSSYTRNKEILKDKLNFTFPLVNNNPYGFKRTVEIMGLMGDYVKNIGRRHLAGIDTNDYTNNYFPLNLYNSDEIFDNGFGTIWRYPYIARWIHEKTTLSPENWINLLKNQNEEILNPKIRYSINCMFFEKDYWNKLDDGTGDDERAVHTLADNEQQQNICVTSIPFVHLFFYSQREENRDILVDIRKLYQQKLNINYPISICDNKLLEEENYLKFLENKIDEIKNLSEYSFKVISNTCNTIDNRTNLIQNLFSVKNRDNKKVIRIMGLKIKLPLKKRD